MTHFGEQVAALRPQLLHFARRQVRNDAWAEDAVSETVLAALEKPHLFGGRCQLKSWLVGILKHKLTDKLRCHTREISIFPDDNTADIDESLFQADGSWREPPRNWGDPELALHERQFFALLESCLELLPQTQARAFRMRVCLELEPEEIQQALGVTSSNLSVLLFRARMRLREHLGARWFNDNSTLTELGPPIDARDQADRRRRRDLRRADRPAGGKGGFGSGGRSDGLQSLPAV